ncbi:alpha/beta hydrolase-fold protein [Kocuria rhizophila]|nr:alpha/beta hydrolase-fold protein [Kocuria rhizophila]
MVIAPEGYDPPSTRWSTCCRAAGRSTPLPCSGRGRPGGAGRPGLPVITVIVSGGKQGWCTDWATQDELTRDLGDLPPGAGGPVGGSHLSTATDREHRLVMGNSMGGYGPSRYAEDRPDLFGEAVSLSGVLDLSSQGRAPELLGRVPRVHGAVGGGVGDGDFAAEEQWKAHDPMTHSASLKGVHVQLFAGQGNGADRGHRARSAGHHRHVRAGSSTPAASPCQYTEYGQVGECDGGHVFQCWRPAAVVALGRWSEHVGIERAAGKPSVAPEFKAVTSGEG